MKIYLVRHGNTFGPGETPVWVGEGTDIPLVEKGREQAAACGRWFKEKGVKPAAIIAGSLKRNKEHAEIISQHLSVSSVVLDPRLSELHYGSWEGKTREEIVSEFGEQEVLSWEEDVRFPPNSNWGLSLETIQSEVSSLLSELESKYRDQDEIILVSSNGRIRFFLHAIPGAFEEYKQERSLKVRTGSISCIELGSSNPRVVFWNESPALNP